MGNNSNKSSIEKISVKASADDFRQKRYSKKGLHIHRFVFIGDDEDALTRFCVECHVKSIVESEPYYKQVLNFNYTIPKEILSILITPDQKYLYTSHSDAI